MACEDVRTAIAVYLRELTVGRHATLEFALLPAEGKTLGSPAGLAAVIAMLGQVSCAPCKLSLEKAPYV